MQTKGNAFFSGGSTSECSFIFGTDISALLNHSDYKAKWFIRESSIENMLTLTFLLSDKITHRRLCFNSSGWVKVSGNSATAQTQVPQLNPSDLSSKEAVFHLYEYLSANGFNLDNMIHPTKYEASPKACYSHYTLENLSAQANTLSA